MLRCPSPGPPNRAVALLLKARAEANIRWHFPEDKENQLGLNIRDLQHCWKTGKKNPILPAFALARFLWIPRAVFFSQKYQERETSFLAKGQNHPQHSVFFREFMDNEGPGGSPRRRRVAGWGGRTCPWAWLRAAGPAALPARPPGTAVATAAACPAHREGRDTPLWLQLLPDCVTRWCWCPNKIQPSKGKAALTRPL